MKRDVVPEDRAEVLREVARFLQDEHGITLVGALGFENAYALAVREADAARLRLRRISDLIPHAAELAIGGDYEFFARPEWAAIQQAYGMEFQRRRTMDASLMYQAVGQSDVDVISAFSTDGRIAAFDLRVLEDDRRAIPPYDAVILASARAVRDFPEVIAALTALTETIDADRMRQMNLAVDQTGDTPERSPSASSRHSPRRRAPRPPDNVADRRVGRDRAACYSAAMRRLRLALLGAVLLLTLSSVASMGGARGVAPGPGPIRRSSGAEPWRRCVAVRRCSSCPARRAPVSPTGFAPMQRHSYLVIERGTGMPASSPIASSPPRIDVTPPSS